MDPTSKYYSPQGISKSFNNAWADLESDRALREKDYRKMPIDDERLKAAYFDVFQHPLIFLRAGPPRESNSQFDALLDMKRRGVEATPMLMEMCRENPYTPLEASVLGNLPALPEIPPEPFLEYARTGVKERGDMATHYAGSYATLLASEGTAADVAMLKAWAKQRPIVAPYIVAGLDYGTLHRKRKGTELVLPPDSGDPIGSPSTINPAAQNSDKTKEENSDREHAWFPGRRFSQWFFWLSVGLAVYFAGKIWWSITHKKTR